MFVSNADLGIRGASAALRSGFKELVRRVGLREVRLILSIDVTRLARNCSDWHPLLDIPGLHGCLIADGDGVYDPGSAKPPLRPKHVWASDKLQVTPENEIWRCPIGTGTAHHHRPQLLGSEQLIREARP
jgi:hypothetical protein